MGHNPPRALKAVAGKVRLQGTDVLKQPANGLRRLRGEKMAMIVQEPMTALNPVMKVGEQIGEVLQIHSDLGLGKRRARVLETMRDVKLPEPETLYHAYQHKLSGGKSQRIMIEMAQNGRESCRESVGQYVKLAVVAGKLQKKKKIMKSQQTM